MKTEEKMKKLALDGLKNREIAEILNLDEFYVRNFVSDYSNPSSNHYNMGVYNQIIMARNLRNKAIVDYDEVEEMTRLVLEGYTFLEVGIQMNKTENDVISQFDKVLNNPYSIYFDKNLYNQIMKKQANTLDNHWDEVIKRLQKLEREGVEIEKYSRSSILKKYRRFQKISSLLQEYLSYNGNVTDQFLAKKYQLEVYDVRGILLGTIDREISEKIIGKDAIEKIRSHRFENLKQIKEDYKNQYQIIGNKVKDELARIEKQKNLWISLMLTFRLSYEQIAKLTQFPTKYLFELKYAITNHLDEQKLQALNYLETEESTEENLQKARRFYYSMLLALQTKQENAKYYLDILNDRSYHTLMKTKKKEEYLPSDYEIIISYVLKYAQFFSNDFETLLFYANDHQKEELNKLQEYLNETLKR